MTFTQAVDVYAFAATALYLAKGSFPSEMKEKPPRAESWTASRGFASLALTIPPRLCKLLDECLSTDPASRPKMSQLRRSIERRLVTWQHRALLVHDDRHAICDSNQRLATLTKQGVATLTIEYTGLGFKVASVDGPAAVNNIPANVGMVIPGCCVIALGVGSSRDFITMDVSRPEVVL